MAFTRPLLTIPPGAPFLPTLAEALLDGRLGIDGRTDPLALSRATIFLPTRRVVSALHAELLHRLGLGAALLPRLLALGEVDEDDLDLDPETARTLDLPAAVSPLDRQIALTRLILAWSRGMRGALLAPDDGEPLLVPSGPGDAAALAGELGRFIDGLIVERVPFERLATLTAEHADRYARHWQITVEFLAIALNAWPDHLAEVGRLEATERRNRLLAAESVRLSLLAGPLIVAGAVGAIPASRDVIAAVARHPGGIVVLPGLDLDLDEAGWAAVADSPGHPQSGHKALLDALGRTRAEVETLGLLPEALAARARLVSNALRPAATTAAWASTLHTMADEAETALQGVTLVQADHEGEEALAIAVALREALETPGLRAALVTPDRTLAARVVAELDRWGIRADDSAGRALIGTPPGIFARLVLDVALSGFAAVPVLALLKHPFAALTLGRARVRRATEALEVGALRGAEPPPGLAGLRRALTAGRDGAQARHGCAVRRRLSDTDWDGAAALLDAVEVAVGPFAALLDEGGALPAQAFFSAHLAAVEAVAGETDTLYAFEAGRALSAFAGELRAVPPADLALPAAEYPGLFAALIAGRQVRGGEPRHPRLAVYGLFEARLMPVDRLVLGGLDEGVWPPEVRTDPWLNRPMRAAIELSAPEKRIGLAAHDFTQGLGAPDVILTRALKRGGSPTIPARWLQRLDAYAGPATLAMRERGAAWLRLARRLDTPVPGVAAAAEPPRPRPPLPLRPDSLSVSEVEDLIRDPYTVYARRVLRLRPMEAVAQAPGAADRGTLVHDAVRRFAEVWAAGAPADAEEELATIGALLFEAYVDYPDVQAFWRPRFTRIASFLAGWESERRPDLKAVAVETSGSITWATTAGRPFTLRARADRIERGADGTVRVIDFKTGAVPSMKQVQSGLAPQLALEAAMLMEAGFADVPLDPDTPLALMAVRLSGSPKDAAPSDMTFKDASAEEVARLTLVRLKSLIDRFEDETTPYASLLHPMFKARRYGDYDHLARVREWSLAGEDGDE